MAQSSLVSEIIRLAGVAIVGSALLLTQTCPTYADEMVDKAIRKGKWDIMLAP